MFAARVAALFPAFSSVNDPVPSSLSPAAVMSLLAVCVTAPATSSVRLPAPTAMSSAPSVPTASPIISVPAVTVSTTLSLVVAIPEVEPTVPTISVFASRKLIAPSVAAASVVTLFVVLVSSENEPVPVLSSSRFAAVSVPVAPCVADPASVPRSIVMRSAAVMTPFSVCEPLLTTSASLKPDESVTLPAVASTIESAAKLMLSPASRTTLPPVDFTVTPPLTEMFSVLMTASSVVVTVTVPDPVVFASNVTGPVDESVIVPAVLLDALRPPSVVIVIPPASASCTLPLPVLANARFVTPISRAFAPPMPPTARITKSCATTLSDAVSPFPSVIAPPASRTTRRPELESSFTATALVSANCIPPEVVLTALSVSAARSMSPASPSAPVSLPMPVAARRSRSSPTRFSFPAPSAAVLSVIAPTLLASEKSLSSAETKMSPPVTTRDRATLPVASSSMSPVAA